MRTLLLALTLAATMFSGCADSDANSKTATSSEPVSTVAVGSESEAVDVTGTIKGTVVDDEQRPIAGAAVGVVSLNVEVETGASGDFELQQVPAGDYDVVANRLGYEATARKVKVVAGEVADVQFILQPIVVKEERVEVQIHKAQHHVGATQYLSWAVNLTADASTLCSGCQWMIYAAPPELMHFEVVGAHTVPSVQAANEYFWLFQKGYSVSGGFTQSRAGTIPLPGSATVEKAALGKGVSMWWAQQMCDATWVCFEEQREMFISVFYGVEEVPEGYTARPPA